jgi:hypothetical protein
MSLDGLTAGIDNKLTFTDANGNLQVTTIENFKWKYDTSIPKKVQMDGTTRHPKFWQGVSGDFTVFRTNPILEQYFSQAEGAYYLGGDQIPVTITQTITNADGTQNQWQFIDCVLDMTDGGNYSGSDVVTQTVTFMGAQRPQTI